MPTAAIVLSRQRLSGYSLLDLIQATLSQHHRQRQLPFKGDRHSSAEWTRHARAKPGEPAELWYRGSLGPSARVHGHGGASGRPRRRVATRVSIVVWGPKKVRFRSSFYNVLWLLARILQEVQWRHRKTISRHAAACLEIHSETLSPRGATQEYSS